MKIIVVLLVSCFTTIFSSASYAEDVSDEELEKSFNALSITVCKIDSNVAETIMTKRQEGVPVSVLLERSLKLKENKDRAKHIRSLIISAYDYPVYTSEESIQKAIKDFREKEELNCLKTAFH